MNSGSGPEPPVGIDSENSGIGGFPGRNDANDVVLLLEELSGAESLPSTLITEYRGPLTSRGTSLAEWISPLSPTTGVAIELLAKKAAAVIVASGEKRDSFMMNDKNDKERSFQWTTRARSVVTANQFRADRSSTPKKRELLKIKRHAH